MDYQQDILKELKSLNENLSEIKFVLNCLSLEFDTSKGYNFANQLLGIMNKESVNTEVFTPSKTLVQYK